MIYLLRYFDPEKGARLGSLVGDKVSDITNRFGSLAAWLQSSRMRAAAAIQALEDDVSGCAMDYSYADLNRVPEPGFPYLLAPVDTQEVWAAGVTYTRSRHARQQEALDGGDIYARVYAAERPEIFFKALGEKVVGNRHMVGIRADASWSVPEPELALVLNPALEVVGMTIGNDMSSRDIEGANPLYLPQAKIYTASCALGPAIALQFMLEWPQVNIYLHIQRDGEQVFSGQTNTALIQRRLDELVSCLGRSASFPDGAALLTGTGIVPPDSFTLQAGDQVAISIDGIGQLTNTVRVV
ncbi:MAG: fumarylacetoacetate hydrolase family protein [Chloroflexota bacterium]